MPHMSRRRLMSFVFVVTVVVAVLRIRRSVAGDAEPPWEGPVAAPPDAPPLHDDPPGG